MRLWNDIATKQDEKAQWIRSTAAALKAWNGRSVEFGAAHGRRSSLQLWDGKNGLHRVVNPMMAAMWREFRPKVEALHAEMLEWLANEYEVVTAAVEEVQGGQQ